MRVDYKRDFRRLCNIKYFLSNCFNEEKTAVKHTFHTDIMVAKTRLKLQSVLSYRHQEENTADFI